MPRTHLHALLLLALACSTLGAPKAQRQYGHPEAPYTEDFQWRETDLSDLGTPGAFSNWEATQNQEVVLRYGGVQATVSSPVPGTLRLHLAADGAPRPPPKIPVGICSEAFAPVPLDTTEDGERVTVRAGGLALCFAKAAFAVQLRKADGEVLLDWQELAFKSQEQGLKSYSRFKLSPRDHFFGLGGKTSPFDRRGRAADLYSVKVETKRGDYGGFALPYFLNPRGYGLILNNPWPRVYFDFGYEDAEAWTLTTPDGPLDLFFLEGPSFLDITRKYHALTGRPALPPKWMLGLWVSWLTPDSAATWRESMKRFRAEKWPADALVLDLYWRGGMVVFSEGGQGKNLDWDRERFGDGPGLLRQLAEDDIHVVLHVNTRMYAGDTLKEGLSRGFLRKSGYEQVVSVFDTPEAREWNWRLYEPRVREGAAAWWVDNGERVDGVLGDELPSRNLYGEQWNQFLFERMNSAGLENRLVLARGGWLGTQTNATQWPGDTGPGVERLREDLWFVGNLALSGAPFSGVDLGGFKADGVDKDIMHTDENIIRRVAHGFLLFPIPRIHNSERSPGKFPWRYSPRVQAVYRRYLELRYAWFPYYYSAAAESAKNSLPLARPLAFDYADPRVYGIDDQLLVGPSLLMAPITETAAHSRYVFLPEGTWYDYWSGERHEGGRSVLVHAGLYARDGLPIFVKAGAILPSRPPAQFNQEEPEREIHLDLYPAAEGSYRLWEDEKTFSEIRYANHGETLEIELQNRAPFPRIYTVACRDGRSIVAMNGSPVPDGVARAELPAGGSAQVSLKLR